MTRRAASFVQADVERGKPFRVASKAISKQVDCWAVLWGSDNSLDGSRRYLIGDMLCVTKTTLFRTRREAREWIDTNYGYLRDRKDLRTDPHGWIMPRPIRVKMTIEARP